MATDFLTSIGRLVQGHAFEGKSTNKNGVPYIDKAGLPYKKYFVAIAFAKTDPVFAQLKADIEAFARRTFPQAPKLYTKIMDGDGIDDDGKHNATKEGFAGHWILKCASNYPFKCFAAGKYAPHEQLQMAGNLNPIPTGHYIRLSGNYTDNGGGNGKPGVYINGFMIEWSRIGDVIVSGPDAATVFGGAQPQAPAPMPPAPAAPAGPLQVQPHTAILTGPQLTPAAGAFSYAQYIAAGHTDASLIAAGYMLPPSIAPVGSAPAPMPPAPAAPTAPAPMIKRTPEQRFIPRADGLTFASYAAWTEQQMIDNGIISAA